MVQFIAAAPWVGKSEHEEEKRPAWTIGITNGHHPRISCATVPVETRLRLSLGNWSR